MRAIYYICAQPANYYYSWQVDAMLLSFEENGQVDLSRVHIVSALQNGQPAHEWFLKVASKWAKKGVTFAYYEDTRPQTGYISSIRPHILEKHWQVNPWLADETIMYHDCDIALTQPIPLHDKLAPGLETTCFLSDTKSYIGAKYIESKGHGLLEDMCAIVGISPGLVRLKESESGGAQYLLKPGIDAQFWQEVYTYSEQLFTQISERVRQIKQAEPEWHELQIWCADMWAVLWSLWKRGYTTPCHEDLDFVWGTQGAQRWDQLPIFHNAGVVKEVAGEPFYKAKYQHKSPITAPIPNERWASHKYFDLVTRAHTATATTESNDNSARPSNTTHIAVVATNIYFLLGLRFIRQFHTYCQEQNIKYHFFSDLDPTPYLKAGMQCQYYPEQHANWQAATNSKFKNMLQIQMAEEDTLFYFDADTSISKQFSTAWFQIGALVGGEHFGNTGHLAGNAGYDRNPESMAYVPHTTTRPTTYYYGAFFGGQAPHIHNFCKQLINWQEWDSQCLDYEPAVNDESYINKYFHYRPPATVASAQFRFNISDKGGLEHFRNATGPTAQQLQAALRLANTDWQISNGQVTQQD